MLQAIGIYDTYMGHMQVKAGGVHPPDLPFFRWLNFSYPNREWPIASKGSGQFVPSRCEFIIDLFPDSITEDEFTKEQAGRDKDKDNHNQKSGTYSAILDREYIDVHMTAKFSNLNMSCHNMTEATMEVDL